MIKQKEKKGNNMKTIAFIILALILTSFTATASETDCSKIKKTSPKYLICKTKAAGSTVKDKLTKKEKSAKKNDSGKQSFFKKFKNAKTLSDLRN